MLQWFLSVRLSFQESRFPSYVRVPRHTDSKEKKEVEIDIVGTPVEGNEYIIGSCKYKNSPVGVDELELLKHYADVFGKGEKYHYYIFSKGGFTEGLQELADKSEVRLVTLQDMYK